MAERVALVSLGCAKNLVDSEVMLGLLAEAGYQIVEEAGAAEVVIVNTCAFIEPAVEEALEALLDLAALEGERKPVVVCAGCLTERYREKLLDQLPEVEAFIGPGSVNRIAEVVRRSLKGERPLVADAPPWLMRAGTPRWRSGAEWSAYVKVAEGCAHRCSYCLVPQLRGPYQSRPAEDIRAECATLVQQGVREICLIAQDTSAYGRDLAPRASLAELVSDLGLEGFDGWVRLQYLHPAGITDELIEAVSQAPAVVPYFDVPLQHADRDILRSMRRPGDAESYLQMLERIRGAIPGAAVRTTFIVGFPGETRRRFEALLEFVQEARFDRLAAFRYWDEQGAASAELPGKVPPEEAQERLDQLMSLQERISLEANRSLVGERLRVLIEGRAEDLEGMVGRSYRDAPEVDGEVLVRAGEGGRHAEAGQFARVVVTDALEHDLAGEIVGCE
jgi:ribosomal protein S12 methylthiotransferase